MKRCIFHYLQPIEEKPGIGSALRPNKMREAFEHIGYQVDEISGSSSQRKIKIEAIKKNIKNGVHYDFLYSESVNTPTLLSDFDHIPRHPFLDFAFFGFCRRNGIPVGLFYRDMHWKFPVYRENVSLWKRMITIPLFWYDLYQYKKKVDVLYVASRIFGEAFPAYHCIPLPPGGVSHAEQLAYREKRVQQAGKLHVLYVGNVLGVYDIQKLCAAVRETEGVHLTICTPENSWKTAFSKYEPLMCDRIRVIHKSSHELLPYFEKTDIFACCLETNEYVRLAMPIKVPEAIGYGVPIMISDGIAAADVIRANGCGWVVEYTTQDIKALFAQLLQNPEKVDIATKNTVSIAPVHTWESRASQVAQDLLKLNKGEN